MNRSQPQSPGGDTYMDPKMRVLVMFLLICNTLLMLFLTNLTLSTKADVADLQTTLATKSDLINLKQATDVNVLEENCSRCHAESRFASFHGSEADLLTMIAEMQMKTGSQINPSDMDKIHASLELLQCNSCHEQSRLRMLGLKTEVEQKEIIRQMLEKSPTTTDHQDAGHVHQSYQQLYGF
jgi:cytochrome c556